MQKQFFYDSYITEFQANILEIIPWENKYALILDNSYFYPESGGQPSDIGSINDYEIEHVIEKNGSVLHITQKSAELGPAKCKINWSLRYDNMQQHSGQHILSACFYKLYKGETSSFHIGKDSSTIEIDNPSLDAEMIEKVEALANSIIYKNTAITADIVGKEAIAALELRKQPQVESDIRIISIEDCDCTPCGGTHVKSTGEIGIIKIKRFEKLKSSCKIEFVCGSRALKDYTLKNHIINRLGAHLSVPEQEIENAYLKTAEDYKNLQKQLSQLKCELVNFEVQQLQQSAEVNKGIKIIAKVFDNRDFNYVKLLAQTLTAAPSCIALLAAGDNNSQLIFVRSDDISENMNDLLKNVLPLINGKGGGSPKSAQGGGTGEVKTALMAAVRQLKL